jgi:pimeloyl-ACP methyl ester carboxylesterase
MPAGEQTRARYPDQTGHVERDGVRTYYEVYGHDGPTIVVLPAWTIFHSRMWKGQIPYLSRHFRVVTFDGRGGGRSDRPGSPADYSTEQIALDALAVMDATGTDRAGILCSSRGAQWALWLATERADRVLCAVFIDAFFPVGLRSLRLRAYLSPALRWLRRPRLPAYPGWLRFNGHYMTSDYAGFLRWFAGQIASDPHSTKIQEDLFRWAAETTGSVAFASATAPAFRTRRELLARARAVSCPVLAIHGTGDRRTPYADGRALARATGGALMPLHGAGHVPYARYPAAVNIALRQFFDAALRG